MQVQRQELEDKVDEDGNQLTDFGAVEQVAVRPATPEMDANYDGKVSIAI